MNNIQHRTSNNQHPMVVRRAPRTGCSMLNVGCWILPIPSIPTGLHPSAQGWPRQRTTLGQPSKIFSNPNGVASARRRLTQPLQGCSHLSPRPRVARASRLRFATARHAQPWVECFESLQDSPRDARKNFHRHPMFEGYSSIGCSMLNVGCWMFPNFYFFHA